MQVISIRKARAISGRLSKKVAGKPAMTAFSNTGAIVAGFAQEVRKLESEKSTLVTERTIDQTDYWEIVDLERFTNFHLDDSFVTLRKAYDKAQQKAVPA